MPTPLEEVLFEQIEAGGPIRLDHYMDLCLSHPEHGYYAQHQAIGGAQDSDKPGDFITAPEVSQMFGEMLAVWVVSTWSALGSPGQLNLIELGPGRGTLMADMLSVLKNQSELMAGLNLYVVDVNAQRWQEKLGDYQVKRIDTLEDLDNQSPTIVVGNEFLDALPIRQFLRMGEVQEGAEKAQPSWAETYVYHHKDEGPGKGPGHLALCQSLAALPGGLKVADDIEVFELNSQASRWADQIAARIKACGGAGLFIDYGYYHAPGQSTLQALRQHQSVDPLSTPGKADITALVDFSMLKAAATAGGCVVSDIVPQADFLRALGIDQRSADLARANPERAVELGQQLHRLTADDQMGQLFKAFSFWSLPKPPVE